MRPAKELVLSKEKPIPYQPPYRQMRPLRASTPLLG